ncbi:MAG TPA: hypothetical protein VG184_03130 [Acidimicrobiales bacterium]|nr:hypothetical protein [Acidimicrobiales bacterium]
MGIDDLPPGAMADAGWAAHLVGSPPCIGPAIVANREVGQATVAYRQTADGAATYPGGGETGGAPLSVVEHLSSYAGSGAKEAYTAATAAIASCRSLTFTERGTRVSVTEITPSTGAAIGQQSVDYEASVTYGQTPLHAEAVVGVDGHVVVMLAYLTPAAPDTATLAKYTGRAASDIALHAHS